MNSLRQNIDVKNTLQSALYITPQMKQSLTLLQMPLQELSQEIMSILENNPVLEVDDNSFDDNNINKNDNISEFDEQNDSFLEENDKLSDIAESVSRDDWEEYIGYEPSDDISYKNISDEDNVDFEQFIGAPVSLYDQLLNQLKIQSFNSRQFKIGEYIIGNLNEDGYFRTNIKDVSNELEVEESEVLYVLSIIKTFEPSGIASQSVPECLITQMRNSGCDEIYIKFAEQILCEFSNELISFKYDEILKGMSIERDTFDYILSLIKKTDPKPGCSFASIEKKYVTPDVFIVRKGKNFDIILNESGLPPIKLNNYYIRMMKDLTLDAQSKQYIKEKVKHALWVIESLNKRQKAIYKVAKAISEFQSEFLLNGKRNLKALKLKDVADATGLHESTVSRATSGKYAMTDYGLIELKSFFAKSAAAEDGDISTNVVKAKIKEMIDNESFGDILSDQRIVDEMEKEGIKIARRTVAKYRDEMNIPTMSQRKRLRR